MGRYGRHSIYVSTNPNVPVNVGTPGVSVFIGCPGPTIYAGTGTDINPSGVLQFIGEATVTLTPATVPVVVEF